METGGCNVTYVLLAHKVSVLHQADCKQHLLDLYRPRRKVTAKFCTDLHVMLLLSLVHA
jgi:hypothetical protein